MPSIGIALRALGLALFTLAGSAQAGLPDCPLDAFAEESAADRVALLNRACGGEHLKWRLDTPRTRAADAGPSAVKAGLSAVSSERILGAQSTLRFDWSGEHQEAHPGLRTQRAVLSAGGWLPLADDWAVQLKLGRELSAAQRTRSSVTGMWNPSADGLLFAEVISADGTTEAQRWGGRWWLAPGRLALDYGWRRGPEGSGPPVRQIGILLDLSR